MQINYLDAISSVLNMMKQPDSACKNIDMHRTCYTTLFKYLMDKGIPFSMDAALDWLEIKKREISYETCSQYRNALFRLEHYLLFGDIKSSFCRSEDSFFCRSGISESFFRLTYELEEYYATTQNPCYYHTYSVAIKEFFRLATSLGVTEPEAITIDTLIEYWNTYCKSCKGNKERTIQLTAKAVEHLREYIRVYHSNSSKEAYLFSTTIKGVTDRMSVGNVQRIIKKYAALVSEKGVSLPDSVHCHMFRRTRATNLYQDGIAIELVSTVLGHARTDTTKSYYAKPSVEQLRDAMESVPTPVSDEAPMWEGNEDEMARLCGLR